MSESIVPIGTRVFVYWNLHRKCWSVRAIGGPSAGRVIAHADVVALDQARGRVGAAGRARVLREGKKNVHAGMVGYVVTAVRSDVPRDWSTLATIGHGVTYNPFKSDTFVYRESGEPFEGASAAILTHTDGRPSVRVSAA